MMEEFVTVTWTKSGYQDSKDRGFASIAIAIDTDVGNTDYINDKEEGAPMRFVGLVF